MMSDKKRHLVRTVTSVAKALLTPLLLFFILALLTAILPSLYFSLVLKWKILWALLPLWMMIPVLLILAFSYWTLYASCSTPNILLNSKKTVLTLKERGKQRLQEHQAKPKYLPKRIILMMGLLWDSRNALMDATDVYGLVTLFSPIFWFLLTITLGLTLLVSSCSFLLCGIFHFFIL